LVRTVGLWRAVVHRSRADWPVVAAAFALLVCAIGLLATGALYGEAVARGGLRQAVLAAPPAERTVVVRTAAAPADVAATDAKVRGELGTALAATGGEIVQVGSSGTLAPEGMTADAARDHLTLISSYENLDRHATLTAGRWAVAGGRPLEATLSDAAAAALGLGLGDRIRLARGLAGGEAIELEVVGLWRPLAGDPYFLGDALELDGVRHDADLTTRGPFVVAEADLAATAGGRQLDLAWRGLPSIDGLAVNRIDGLRTGVEGLRPALRSKLPPPREVSVTTNLPSILAAASSSILVSRSGVTLLTIQFAVLAGYAVLLVAGLLIERRRSETALLRSRGASSGHLVALAFGEAVLLTVPAAIAGPFIAVAAVRLLGVVGPLGASGVVAGIGVTEATISASVLAAIGCIVVLTVPSLVSEGTPAGIRAALGRQVGRTMAQRLGIDLALVALAVVALWQLRLYGAPLTRNARGVLGVDPLLVAAPAIGLLAGAVLATRLIPRLAEIGERTLSRGRGIVSPLGARQVARRPLRYTRSALLLILAAALGTFAATSAATWARSQVDQATYRSAGDIRAILSDYPDLPDWEAGSAFRSIPGVTAATPVSGLSLDIGRTVRDGRLLAVDPEATARIVRFPPEAAGAPALLDRLAQARPTTAAVPLDGTPRRLALTLDADLTADPAASGDTAIPADWQGLAATVILQDADGRLHRVDAGETALQGTGERLEIPLAATLDGVPVEAASPLRLESIELNLTPPPDRVMTGSVDLVGVETSQSETGGDWAPVSLDPGSAGWTWTREDAERSTVYRPPEGSPGRLQAGLGDEESGPLLGLVDRPGATFRLTADPTGDGTLAAIAGDHLLALTGAHVGDTIAVDSAAQSLTVRIVGSVGEFPPLDPNGAFLVVDGASLNLVSFATSGSAVSPTEWWLAADDRQAAAIATTLRTRPYSVATVLRRTELAAALANDPIWLGIVGALGLGALAAVVFATIGFTVGATVSTSERLGELALLRALGLSGRQLSLWLTLEQVFLVAVGLVGGILLGLLLAWLVLPYATLSASGAAVVPAPVIVVPWATILPASVALAALLLVIVAILARQVPERRVSGVLRAGET
jgi:hypothetical protein